MLSATLLALGLAGAPAQGASLDDLADGAARSHGGVFGSYQFRSASLRAFPQWQRVLDETQAERAKLRGCLDGTNGCGSEALRAWRRAVRKARGLGRRAQLEVVNRYFNRWPYVTDRKNYGRIERWASPLTFLRRSGDCEDFAIVKFATLRELGFADDELRIVVLRDRIRSIRHAVLAVYDGDHILILDSLSDYIFADARYSHYVAQYSMNETSSWTHIPRRP